MQALVMDGENRIVEGTRAHLSSRSSRLLAPPRTSLLTPLTLATPLHLPRLSIRKQVATSLANLDCTQASPSTATWGCSSTSTWAAQM